MARLRQEVEAAARVQGLYTAQVIDADPMAVPPWMVTAYVPGPSLQQAVRDHGLMPARTVFQLMAGVAEALQAIHSAGVVHRDLKPSNVLLAPDGPRVIDFGIARAADATALTRTGMRVGSPQFMAPEQIAGHSATPATDIFGLGALAAYAALGRAPFGNAVRLMYAGAASAVVNAIVGAAAVYSVVHHILAQEPGANQNTVNTVTAIDVALTIFFGLAGIALWLWMTHANRNGRSWARILSTVLFAVLTLSLPFAFIQVPYVLPWITSIAQWVLAVAALVLLWVGPSSAYFAAMRRPAGSPPGTAWHGPQRPDNAGVQRDPGAFGPLREPGNW